MADLVGSYSQSLHKVQGNPKLIRPARAASATIRPNTAEPKGSAFATSFDRRTYIEHPIRVNGIEVVINRPIPKMNAFADGSRRQYSFSSENAANSLKTRSRKKGAGSLGTAVPPSPFPSAGVARIYRS